LPECGRGSVDDSPGQRLLRRWMRRPKESHGQAEEGGQSSHTVGHGAPPVDVDSHFQNAEGANTRMP